MKIIPVGAELIHADRLTERKTDVTKLIVAFRNFADEAKNLISAVGTDTPNSINFTVSFQLVMSICSNQLACEIQ